MNGIRTDDWEAFRREASDEAFAPIFRGSKSLVYTICFRVLRNREDALDAFQATYARLLGLVRSAGQCRAVADASLYIGGLAFKEAGNFRQRRARLRVGDSSKTDRRSRR